MHNHWINSTETTDITNARLTDAIIFAKITELRPMIRVLADRIMQIMNYRLSTGEVEDCIFYTIEKCLRHYDPQKGKAFNFVCTVLYSKMRQYEFFRKRTKLATS